MRKWTLASCGLASLVACGGAVGTPVSVDPAESAGGGKSDSLAAAVPDVSCDGVPDAGAPGKWRHRFESPVIAALGEARHRGIDLIAAASNDTQKIAGELSYGTLDKALEDEAVDLFACRDGSWSKVGSTITDGEGKFELDLQGAARLPLGLRSLYASVVGDRTGVAFVALVAPDGAAVFISDVDGTLTSSENAFPDALITRADVQANEGAPAALTALRGRGYLPIYTTARGRIFTQPTRDWLNSLGFPRGALRLAPTLVTLPGSATIDYKSSTFAAIGETGLVPAVGIGNRASDATAYGSVGIAGDHVFLKLPEFSSEDAAPIAAGKAVGFASYVDEASVFTALPIAP